MKTHIIQILAGVVLSTLLLISVGCESTPEEIPPDLTKAEMFQRAQEAGDQENWEQAIAYYEEFIRRFPDDQGAIAEARYEIAFLTYKLGDLEKSLALFEDLLATYETDSGTELPEWPQVLSQRVMEKIREQMAPESTGQADDEAGSGSE